MKITYRREMKHNYLIVDPESLTWRNYECRMLTANSIEGVLHFQIRQVDDEIRFYYEITSKQPLDRMLESRSVHTEELRSLVFGISRVLDRMEQYLLPEGSVLLEPEYIYVEPETFRIWLCLVPGLGRDFPEDYGKLLEYLLGKVDHQDKDSVVLAYGIYQETRKENYGMEDILRLFSADLGGESQESSEDLEELETMISEESGRSRGVGGVNQSREKESEGTKQRWSKERGIKSKEKSKEKDKAKDKGKTGLWSRLMGWWNRRERETEMETVQVPWEMMFREEDMRAGVVEADEERTTGKTGQSGEPGQLGQGGQLRQMGPMEWPVQPMGQPAQPMGQPAQPGGFIQPGQDTVLLADLRPDTRTKLHCLRPLDEDGEKIVISYYPFIIGKQENLVDHLLPYDTVSRLHLRIDREGERYFVQDLNSTNGTTVEGRLLENNESVEIHEGDEIHIARYRYRFEL